MMRPWFYDSFVCAADRCSDNCCIGWEIDIDPAAMERFKSVGGKFGEKLRAAIHTGEQPVFALSAGERCALLREDGLCELILNCGEDMLCDICALHPRFFNAFGEVSEGGLGLCCEEVCRLMFSRSEPLKFIKDPEDIAAERLDDEKTALMRRARDVMFSLLQDRKMPIAERISRCAEYGWRLQQAAESGGLPALPSEWESIFTESFISRLLELYAEMESINDEWTDALAVLSKLRGELAESLPLFLARVDEHRYEHIAVYTLFRQFTDSLYDEQLYARVMLACCAALTVMLMDCVRFSDSGKLTDQDCIQDLKLFSKQVEYSQENIDTFLVGI